MAAAVIAAAIAAIPIFPCRAAEVIGHATVADGDELRIAGANIRLFGLSAPERFEQCRRGEVLWNCGAEAYEFLLSSVIGRRLICEIRGDEPDRRVSGVCRLQDGTDVGRRLVAAGLAVAAGDYADAETEARAAGLGLWAPQ